MKKEILLRDLQTLCQVGNTEHLTKWEPSLPEVLHNIEDLKNSLHQLTTQDRIYWLKRVSSWLTTPPDSNQESQKGYSAILAHMRDIRDELE